jgi:hypothetical protein
MDIVKPLEVRVYLSTPERLDLEPCQHRRSILVTLSMFVAGVDGCRAGWIAFKIDVPSLVLSVDVVDLPKLLSSRPNDLLCLAIDIPMGLLDSSRACDKAARKLLGHATRCLPIALAILAEAEQIDDSTR